MSGRAANQKQRRKKKLQTINPELRLRGAGDQTNGLGQVLCVCVCVTGVCESKECVLEETAE